MNTVEMTVKTQDGGEFTFEMPLPESLEEAAELYNEDNALWLLNSGLTVKLQNIAREYFRQGKTRDEAEEAVRKYRPGASARRGAKQQAIELLTEKSGVIMEDPDLKAKVKEAFAGSKWKDVVALLENA